jgi:hypothetical protein
MNRLTITTIDSMGPRLRNHPNAKSLKKTKTVSVQRDHKSPPDETPAKSPVISDGDGGSTSDDEASTSSDSDSADGSVIETSDDEASTISDNYEPMKVIYDFTEDKAVDGAEVMAKTKRDFAKIIKREGLVILFMHMAWVPQKRQLIAVFYGPGALALSNINPKNLKKHKSVAFNDYDVVRVLAWKWLEADLTPGSLMVTNCL